MFFFLSTPSQTPLLLAVQNGFVDGVKCLVDHGANVNFKDRHGVSE